MSSIFDGPGPDLGPIPKGFRRHQWWDAAQGKMVTKDVPLTPPAAQVAPDPDDQPQEPTPSNPLGQSVNDLKAADALTSEQKIEVNTCMRNMGAGGFVSTIGQAIEQGSIIGNIRRRETEAEATVQVMRRHLHETMRHVMHRFPFTSDQARRMIRLEVDYERERVIAYTMHRYGFTALHEREGPTTFEGFDVYVVNRLPEPGWRVVNPMEKRT